MKTGLKEFEFLFKHSLLKEEYVTKSLGKKYHAFSFSDGLTSFGLQVPYQAEKIVWGWHSGTGYYHSSRNLSRVLPLEYLKILKEASASLKKRDRIRKLFINE